MAVHYRAQGFVIKKTDRGESDCLFTIYTEEFGKLDILGRAIRKIKSKLRSSIELFYLSEVEFIQGKTNKTLTDAIVIESFSSIRKGLERLKIVHQIAEVLDNLIVREEKDEQVWQLLEETFNRLGSSKKIEIIYYYFFWNLVSILGYQPELDNCSICGKKVNIDVFKILRIILKKDWKILSRLKIESFHQELLKEASENYLSEILEKN